MNRLFVNCQVHMIHCESSAKVAEGRLNCKKRGHPPGAKRRNLYFPKSILAPRSKTARAFTTGLRTIQGGLPYEMDGDARRKIRIKTLKETNLGVTRALFYP